MSKRNFQIVMSDDVHAKLKANAALNRMSIGDYIANVLSMVEQKAEQRKKLLREAGLTDYLHQPDLNLAMMSDATIVDMQCKASELSKPTEVGWESGEFDESEW